MMFSLASRTWVRLASKHHSNASAILSIRFPFRLQRYSANGHHGTRLLRQLRISSNQFLWRLEVRKRGRNVRGLRNDCKRLFFLVQAGSVTQRGWSLWLIVLTKWDWLSFSMWSTAMPPRTLKTVWTNSMEPLDASSTTIRVVFTICGTAASLTTPGERSFWKRFWKVNP